MVGRISEVGRVSTNLVHADLGELCPGKKIPKALIFFFSSVWVGGSVVGGCSSWAGRERGGGSTM